MLSDPSSQERQINPEPIINRIGERQFAVFEISQMHWGGANINYALQAYCEYCHKDISVILSAPKDCQEFFKKEARRVALRQHLRTEHPTKKN